MAVQNTIKEKNATSLAHKKRLKRPSFCIHGNKMRQVRQHA
jgi:hypothetical protein